jgi:hypothetical protein
MEAMGESVKFAIDEVCQGRESTIAVMWHLGEFLYCEFKFKCGWIMMTILWLQNGMVTSSPLQRAAPSANVQEMKQRFLSGR